MFQRRLLRAAGVVGLLIVTGGAWLLAPVGVGGDMTEAATKLLSSLDAQQKTKITMAFGDAKRTDWHFIPKDTRKGLQFKELNEEQRKLAIELLRVSLSKVGYEKARTIMANEPLLKDAEKNKSGSPLRDPERYFFTIFGTPSDQGEWGLSIEGHHVSLNFVIRDGKLAATTPIAFGANPAEIKTDTGFGAPKGTRLLKAEEDFGFQLINALDEAQRKTATIAARSPTEVREAGKAQPPAYATDGLQVSKLNEEHTKIFWSLIEAHCDNLPEEEKTARIDAIKSAGLDKVYFAWAGALKLGDGHYYRVQGPTFIIEFVNNQADVFGNPANHIHSVWRNTAGDFGVKR